MALEVLDRAPTARAEEILTDDRRAAILREEAEERRAVRGAYDAVAAALGPAGFRWIDAEGTETAVVDAPAAGAALIASTAAATPALAGVTAVVAVLSVATRLHPLWLLGAGAAFGLLGVGFG